MRGDRLAPFSFMGRAQKACRVAASRVSGVVVVCSNLQDPRNAAAILRTCEALGILEVYVIEEEHPFAPSPRVTRGADKWRQIRRFRRVEPALDELCPRGFRVFAATPQGQPLPEGLPVETPLALLFGNETEGVAPEILARCHGTFRVPMWGFVQSLNVSVATGVALYVVVTARRRALGQTGDLSPSEQEALWRKCLEA